MLTLPYFNEQSLCDTPECERIYDFSDICMQYVLSPPHPALEPGYEARLIPCTTSASRRWRH